MTKNTSVFGVYPSTRNLEWVVTAFKDAGFSNSDISVLSPDKSSKEIIAENATKAPEGTAVGVGSGAALGGAMGWLVGVGALAIPGIGPVIAAGPIVAALAGVSVGGALGGFAGCLIGVGISEPEAEKYQGQLLKGGTLLAVHCDTVEETRRAKEIMQTTGGEDVACSQNAPVNSSTSAA
jgi:hypothetical protein